MKQEVNPVIMWVTLGVIVCVILVIGFRALNPNRAVETTGSESNMKKLKETGSFYTPSIPTPGTASAGTAPGTAPPGPGGYNLTPPSH